MPFYKIDQEGKPARLVEAGTPAEALRHVAKSTFTISDALTPSGIVEVMTAGAKAEKAGQFAEDASVQGGPAGGEAGKD